MSTGVALFGLYPSLPSSIRSAGRQATYAGGHAIYVQRWDADYVPGFLEEFSGETGSKITDCVPASGVRGVNFMTRGAKAPTSPAEREALQNAMGTQDASANESQLASGVQKRYGLTVSYGQSWSAIVAAIGSETTLVRVGDPLGTRDLQAPLSALKAYAAGLQNRYVLFPQKVLSPVISRQLQVTVKAGSYRVFQIPGGTTTPDRSVAVVFSRSSWAPVKHGIPGHWQVTAGGSKGLYYIAGRSGPFGIRRADKHADGTTTYTRINPAS